MERKAFIAVFVLFVPLLILAGSPQALRDASSFISAKAGAGASDKAQDKDKGATTKETEDAAQEATPGELLLNGRKVAADGTPGEPLFPAEQESPRRPLQPQDVVLNERARAVTMGEVEARSAACEAYATAAREPAGADAAAASVQERRLEQLWESCSGSA